MGCLWAISVPIVLSLIATLGVLVGWQGALACVAVLIAILVVLRLTQKKQLPPELILTETRYVITTQRLVELLPDGRIVCWPIEKLSTLKPAIHPDGSTDFFLDGHDDPIAQAIPDANALMEAIRSAAQSP